MSYGLSSSNETLLYPVCRTGYNGTTFLWVISWATQLMYIKRLQNHTQTILYFILYIVINGIGIVMIFCMIHFLRKCINKTLPLSHKYQNASIQLMFGSKLIIHFHSISISHVYFWYTLVTGKVFIFHKTLRKWGYGLAQWQYIVTCGNISYIYIMWSSIAYSETAIAQQYQKAAIYRCL